MRISLGAALFLVISGIALFGIGLTYTDTYYIGSGVAILLLGTVFAAILMWRRDTDIASTHSMATMTAMTPALPAKATDTLNPVMKKNKSDSNLELMGHMEESL